MTVSGLTIAGTVLAFGRIGGGDRVDMALLVTILEEFYYLFACHDRRIFTARLQGRPDGIPVLAQNSI